MRLSNELDQQFVRAAVPDGATDLLSFLPSLGVAETMVFGESVNLPMRVILNNLAAEFRPHSSSAQFTELWQEDQATPQLMNLVFDRWRSRSLTPGGKSVAAIAAAAGGPNATGARAALRRQTGQRAPAAQPHRPAQPAGSLAAQAREKLMAQQARAQAAQAAQQAQAPARPQRGTVGDVKNKLNAAFHRKL